MKKLKIFLLLSILLCFGFILSSEVHAQGDGPKTLEINDVLPDPTTLPTGTGMVVHLIMTEQDLQLHMTLHHT